MTYYEIYVDHRLYEVWEDLEIAYKRCQNLMEDAKDYTYIRMDTWTKFDDGCSYQMGTERYKGYF